MARKPKINLKELTPRVEAALLKGLSHKQTCAEVGISRETFYKYIKADVDFADTVTRAQQKADQKAVVAFQSGFDVQKRNDVQIVEFSETRLRKAVDKNTGQVIEVPYQYVKRTNTTKMIESPPDWRAGEAWLERRDPEEWGKKQQILVSVDIKIVKQLEAAAARAGVDLSKVFEEMTNELGALATANSPALTGAGGVSTD